MIRQKASTWDLAKMQANVQASSIPRAMESAAVNSPPRSRPRDFLDLVLVTLAEDTVNGVSIPFRRIRIPRTACMRVDRVPCIVSRTSNLKVWRWQGQAEVRPLQRARFCFQALWIRARWTSFLLCTEGTRQGCSRGRPWNLTYARRLVRARGELNSFFVTTSFDSVYCGSTIYN